ncbi:hypothetical protein HMPREF9543_04601 [Escherichia coli MS 146-1]|nr:hypothetical protein HMPREF9543_04601 [Escherichia coli MS 146-1]
MGLSSLLGRRAQKAMLMNVVLLRERETSHVYMNVVNIYILEEIDLTYMVFTFKDNTYITYRFSGYPDTDFRDVNFIGLRQRKGGNIARLV